VILSRAGCQLPVEHWVKQNIREWPEAMAWLVE
jgi:hypothetical protein